MPLLGAGSQQYDARVVIDQILVAARRELEDSLCLERVVVCEVDPERARQVEAALRAARRRWPNVADPVASGEDEGGEIDDGVVQ